MPMALLRTVCRKLADGRLYLIGKQVKLVQGGALWLSLLVFTTSL